MSDFNVNSNIVELDTKMLEKHLKKYDKELLENIKRVANIYNQKIVRDAKEIIRQEDKIDTGRLRNSIKSNVKNLTLEIYSNTKYARFIHEGAKHDGNNIVPHFVPFKKAPSLLVWAIRNKVIERKSKNGKGKYLFKYVFKSKRTGKEYDINPITGGLVVKIMPTKFLEKPFEKYKKQYVKDLSAIISKL